MEKIIKAWRAAHGERNLGNLAAAENAEKIAQSLEYREGLAVWSLDRRRRSWVPSLWRRAGCLHEVLVLVDQDDRLVLMGSQAGLEATRDHAGPLENTLSKHSDTKAWEVIAAMPEAPPSFVDLESSYIPWASVRLNCEVDRAAAVEI